MVGNRPMVSNRLHVHQAHYRGHLSSQGGKDAVDWEGTQSKIRDREPYTNKTTYSSSFLGTNDLRINPRKTT
jgi:hypothetical protein